MNMHLFWLVDISSILIIRYFECYSFMRKRKYHTKHRGAASEMAQWIKILPVKSENLSSQPGDSHGGTRKQFMQVGLKRKWGEMYCFSFHFFFQFCPRQACLTNHCIKDNIRLWERGTLRLKHQWYEKHKQGEMEKSTLTDWLRCQHS